MKFNEFLKQNKLYVICVIVVIAFFGLLMVRHSMQLAQVENEYKEEIEELRSLVNVTNIGKSPELEYDIYDSAENFVNLFYGVSKEINQEYRSEKLNELMTQDAFINYVEQGNYDNSLDYEVTISNLKIYVDYKNSSKAAVDVCIFYEENTDWAGINTITLPKYWKGIFKFDEVSDTWRVDEIIVCQELLTREEYDKYITDTDISTTDLGGEENADARTGTEENP